MVDLGPQPAHDDNSAGALTPQRAAVLERLQQLQPATAQQLASDLGLHLNTVREHLAALTDRGYVGRSRQATSERGRPPWSYVATRQGERDVRLRDYAGLAGALAACIDSGLPDVRPAAIAAGQAWGGSLAEDFGTDHSTLQRDDKNLQARLLAIALLNGNGFEPHTDTDTKLVRLRRCPLLDVARRYPEVMCSVHLGLVQGALDQFGGDSSGCSLVPFAEPGACILRMNRQSP